MTQEPSKRNPQVTVLMSVYNGERYLREAIESVLAQTFADFELLIINDGSTDGTAAILGDYSDSRIRVVSNEKNIGVTCSRNKGLHLARGKYVACMDADDVSLPERLRLQARYLDTHPDVGLLSSAYEVVDDDGNSLAIVNYRWGPEAIYYRLQFCNFTAGPDTMFRTDVVLKIGGYDERCKRAPDYDLWTRLSRVTKIDQLPTLLYVYRSHHRNITHTYRDEQQACANRSWAANLAKLMGGDTCNVEAITPIRYAAAMYPYTKRITYDSLCELEKIEERLVSQCPVSLDIPKLKVHCESMLGLYIFLMVAHLQIRDVLQVLRRPRFRRALVGFMWLKICNIRGYLKRAL